MENVQQSLVPVDGSGGPDPPGAVDSSFLDLASSVHSTTLLDQLDTLPNSTGKGSECPSLLARPTDSSLDQPNPTESRINPDAMTTMEQGIMMDVQYSSSSPKNEEFLAAQSLQSLKSPSTNLGINSFTVGMAAVSAEVMPTDTVSTDITPTEAMTIVAKSAEHMPVEFMPTEFIQTEVMQTATALSSPLSEPSSELAINCSMDPVTEPEMESLMLSPPDVTMSGNDSSSDDKEGLSTPSTPIDDEVANIEILEVEGMAAMSPEVMALMGDRLPAPKYSARQSKQPVRYGYDSEPANPTKRKAQNIAQDSAVARNIRPRISKASPSPAHHIDEKANGVSDEGRAILDSGMQAMVGTQDVSGELEVNTNVAIGQGTGQHLAMSDASLKTADGLSIILPREATLGLRTQLLHSHGSVNQDGSFPCTTSWDTNADKDSTEILSKVKKDRQIKSAYGISSLRILQGQILVRKACACCEVFESWACNRKTPCSVCLRGGNKDHIEACRMERAFEFAAAPVKRGNQFKVEEDAAAMAVPAMGSVMAPFSLGSFVATASLQPFRPLASKLPSNTPVRSIGRRLQNIPVHPLLAVKVLPPIPDKPEATADCSGQPSMWAASRAELCETIPWHRGWQSGAYHTDGHARGLLLDKCAGVRDFVGSRVVIARAGGDRIVDNNGGITNAAGVSSIASSTIGAFRRSMEDCSPIGLIIGDSNPKAPAKLPHLYCGLDWFLLVSIWSEKEGNAVWTKYRFEKMNPATPAWWVPEGFNIDAPNSAGIRAPRSSCQACGKESAQLYEEGWTCLYRECTAFWTHEGRKITNEDLHYLDSYLHERNPPRISVRPAYSFKPKPLVTPPGVLGFSTSRACWKGFCCPDCGRCNSRIEWSGWECIGCGLKHDAPHIVFSAALISNGDQPLPSGHAFPSGSFLSPVIAQDSVHGKYRRQDLEVPGAGRIVIFRSNTVINAEENGPDHMFEDLQRPDHPLRRLTIENGRVSKLITRHFAMNHGMSYKYAAAVATNPMSGAPESVRHAMGRLTWAKNLVEDHDQRTPTANEILTLGYMEDQSIGYHDDGETGLGPVIATLSLGMKASMKLRLKAKYNSLDKFKPNDEEPVPGCIEYEKRLHAWVTIQKASEEDRAEVAEDLWESMQMAKCDLKKQPQRHVPIEFPIRHGDIVIMQGARLQKIFEHSVVPANGLRFAITARYIDPDSVQGTDEWKQMITQVDETNAHDYRHDADYGFGPQE